MRITNWTGTLRRRSRRFVVENLLKGSEPNFLHPHLRQRVFLAYKEAKNSRRWQHSKLSESNQQWKNYFVHIPKTGGTSIRASLSRNSNWTDIEKVLDGSAQSPFQNIMNLHLSTDFLVRKGFLPANCVSNAYSFCFVRNPYARALSLYRYLGARNYFPRHYSLIDFLDLVRRERPRVGGAKIARLSMAAPQTAWTRNIEWKGFSDIFKLEELDSALKVISDNTGANLREEHLNISSRDARAPEAELDSRAISLINLVYESDFISYGYPMIGSLEGDASDRFLTKPCR